MDNVNIVTIFPLNELGFAQRFKQRWQDLALFAAKSWWVWTGQKFELSDVLARQLGRETAEAIHSEIVPDAVYQTTDGTNVTAGDILDFAENCCKISSIKAMLQMAATFPELRVTPSLFNQQKDLLPCANGVVDLRTSELREHEPKLLFTRVARASYDLNVTPTRFLEFLEQVSKGDHDLQAYLQTFFGYCLTGHCSEQVLLIFHGHGSNGKSTLLDIALDVMGDFGLTTPASTLVQGLKSPIRNDLARLHGARLISAIEVGQGQRFDEPIVKQLTGEDIISARFLRRENFEFTSQGKIVIAANHLPGVNATDHAIRRRLKVVPFRACFKDAAVDKALKTKLRAEADGILAWMVEGARLWYAEGLREPKAVTRATAAFMDAMDQVGEFLADTTSTHAGKNVSIAGLYEAYTTWANENGEDALAKGMLAQILQAKGFEKGKSNRVRTWKGLSLRTEPIPQALATRATTSEGNNVE
jgi:putative DNA primase/helicase